MSHISKIELVIHSLGDLKKACRQLGFDFMKDQKTFKVECDTLVICGKFRPDSALIDNTPIEWDPFTLGPLVDANLMSSVSNIFAVGNILRGADPHDLCALERMKAAKSIIKRLYSKENNAKETISIRAEPPIRFVVPQNIFPDKTNSYLFYYHQ